MAFSEENLLQKFKHINTTQQCIQSISQYALTHKKRARQIVDLWNKEILRAPSDRQLAFVYLANDVLQNSKKHGIEFINEFTRVVPSTFPQIFQRSDDASRKSLLRILDIWVERRVFPAQLLSQIRKQATSGASAPAPAAAPATAASQSNHSQSNSIGDSRARALADALTTADAVRNPEADAAVQALGANPTDATLIASANFVRSAHAALEAEVAARTKAVNALSELLEAQEPALAAATNRLQHVKALKARVDQLAPASPASRIPSTPSPAAAPLAPTPAAAASLPQIPDQLANLLLRPDVLQTLLVAASVPVQHGGLGLTPQAAAQLLPQQMLQAQPQQQHQQPPPQQPQTQQPPRIPLATDKEYNYEEAMHDEPEANHTEEQFDPTRWPRSDSENEDS